MGAEETGTGLEQAQEFEEVAGVVERNIEALLARRRQEQESRSVEQWIVDGITRFAGSMAFVYLHLIGFGAWVVLNMEWLPITPFDPSFVLLAGFASVEAIFISTFVLISQNRMAALQEKHAGLDLQVSLLAEHEITRLITLVTAIAERMDLQVAKDPELEDLRRDVAPERVLDKIEAAEQQAEADRQA